MRLVTGQPGGTLRTREVETRLSGNSYFQWLVNEDGCIQIAVERQMRGACGWIEGDVEMIAKEAEGKEEEGKKGTAFKFL